MELFAHKPFAALGTMLPDQAQALASVFRMYLWEALHRQLGVRVLQGWDRGGTAKVLIEGALAPSFPTALGDRTRMPCRGATLVHAAAVAAGRLGGGSTGRPLAREPPPLRPLWHTDLLCGRAPRTRRAHSTPEQRSGSTFAPQ